MTAPSATPLLAIRGLRAAYGKIEALKGVDLAIDAGEIVALIGANGAGKSTLMMTVFGKPRARSGRIEFDGRDITDVPTHEIARMRIAQSPEGRRIFPRMSVAENLQMGADATDSSDSGSRRRAGARADAVPASERAHGPARRHLVGRRAADAGDRPRADEPPSPVDAGRALARLRPADRAADFRRHPHPEPAGRLTVLIVEQNANHALRLAHRGYVMVNGLITLSGTGTELLQRPEIRAAYLEGGRRG